MSAITFCASQATTESCTHRSQLRRKSPKTRCKNAQSFLCNAQPRSHSERSSPWEFQSETPPPCQAPATRLDEEAPHSRRYCPSRPRIVSPQPSNAQARTTETAPQFAIRPEPPAPHARFLIQLYL